MLTIIWGLFFMLSLLVMICMICYYGALFVLWPILKIIGQFAGGIILLAGSFVCFAVAGLFWLVSLSIDLYSGKFPAQFRWRPQAMPVLPAIRTPTLPALKSPRI